MEETQSKEHKNLPPEEKQLYHVEKIVRKKMKAGQTYYFVKWMGYPDSDNTWEPIQSLKSVFPLVKQFED